MRLPLLSIGKRPARPEHEVLGRMEVARLALRLEALTIATAIFQFHPRDLILAQRKGAQRLTPHQHRRLEYFPVSAGKINAIERE